MPLQFASTEIPQVSDPFADKLRQRFQAIRNNTEEDPWRTSPVPFAEFVTSADHMRFPALSEKQLEAAYALLNRDPKKTFDVKEKLYDVCVCLWGKGCLSADEKVVDAVTGQMSTIEALAQQHRSFNVRAFDFKSRRLIATKAEPPVLEGEDELFEVNTEARYQVRVSADHKFYTPTGWKPLKDLVAGSAIATTFGLPLLSDMRWTKITYIRPLGKGSYYGLTVPETGNYVHSGLLHANSGKDSLAALITCYVVYLLLCLKNPYLYLTGYDVPDEAIDIVNVAYSYDQASNVFFTKFRSRVKNWRWLRKNFRVRESGKDLDPAQNKRDFLSDKSFDTVTIYPSAIMFPNMIRAFSRHSRHESTEGLNVLVWLLDEASAMRDGAEVANADKLYEMLKTSAQSRFPSKWLGFVLSYPRHKKDFTMRMYKNAIDGKLPRVFASKAATWEVNPTKKFEDFQAEIENPETSRDAKAKYACEPPDQEAGFIERPDMIQACIYGHPQIAEFTKTRRRLETGVELIAKSLLAYNTHRQPDSKRYVARVDLGHVNDRSALAVGHLEGEKVVIDLLTHWQAEPEVPIDIDDPATLIIKLKRELVNIVFASYDQWNSLSSLNRLNRMNIVSDRLSLTFEDYKLFRSLLYSKMIELPNYTPLTDRDIGELVELKLFNGNKVDHPKDGHNDLSEAVVGVCAMLKGTKKNVEEVKSTEGHYRENENDAANTIWTTQQGEFMEDRSDPFIGGAQGVSVKLHGR